MATDVLQPPSPSGGPSGAPSVRRRLVSRLVRGLGWSLITFGVIVLLYLVYLLWFTNLETERAQAELLDQWELEFGDVEAALPGESVDDPDAAQAAAEPVDPGSAYAAMWFERDGERIVHADTLFVVEGVTLDHLRRGPGHYPESVAPGQRGNFGVSGHRTTYGAPFYNLDQLQEGDEIHVVDRGGREWVYEVSKTQIVAPTATWVIKSSDPLGTGRPTITLTTCNPRFSAAQRLIVWGELREDEGTSA